jgi:hypothetical protein
MDTTNSEKANILATMLAQQVEDHFDELTASYYQTLRETLFSNRAMVRPAMLKDIATDQAKALLDYFHQSDLLDTERGAYLSRIGLGELSVLRLAQSTRQYFLRFLKDGQIAPTMDLVDGYYNALIVAYFRRLEKDIFEEQERTRHAFMRVVERSPEKP